MKQVLVLKLTLHPLVLLAMEWLHELLRWGAGEAAVTAGAGGGQEEKQRREEWWASQSVLVCRLVVLSAAVCLTVTHPFTVNPAFIAQDCFQRIDRRLRATLKRKQIPMVSVIFSTYMVGVYVPTVALSLSSSLSAKPQLLHQSSVRIMIW